MAFQAGQFETAQAFRRRRIVRPVESRNALERDAVQLFAHVREACRVAIEVDQVNLHGASAQRFPSGSFSGRELLALTAL